MEQKILIIPEGFEITDNYREVYDIFVKEKDNKIVEGFRK